VISGRVKVMVGEADGKETILCILGAGEFFGEMSLIDDNPRSASVGCDRDLRTAGTYQARLQEMSGREPGAGDGCDADPGAAPARSRPQDRQPGDARRVRPRGAACCSTCRRT
jgi:hypothetical protein